MQRPNIHEGVRARIYHMHDVSHVRHEPYTVGPLLFWLSSVADPKPQYTHYYPLNLFNLYHVNY